MVKKCRYAQLCKHTCAIVEGLGRSKGMFWVIACFLVLGEACRKQNLSESDKIAADMSGIQMSYVETGNAVQLDGQVYPFTPDFVGVPVSLSASAGNDDTIFAAVDPSLVASYNSLYNENNTAIPPGAFATSGNGAFAVKAGTTYSNDSLYAILKDASQLADSTLYLVPVRLTDKNGGKPTPSVVCFKMRIYKMNLGVMIDTASPVAGTTPDYYNGGYLLDYLFNVDNNNVMVAPDEFDIGILLNAAFPQKDLKVSAQIYNDDSTIQSVGSYYTPFPANTFALSTTDFTIPAGSKAASDSLKLEITNKALFQPYTNYLLVIKLQPSSDPAYTVPLLNNDAGTLYISFFVF